MKLSSNASGLATVTHGVWVETLPIAGLTVGEVRTRLADRLDLDPLTRAYVGGRPALDETPVPEGAVLGFVRLAGEKGNG